LFHDRMNFCEGFGGQDDQSTGVMIAHDHELLDIVSGKNLKIIS